MRTVILLVTVAALILLALGAWARDRGPRAADAGDSDPSPGPRAANTLPVGPVAPPIASDTWFNSPPLAPQDLRGRVVVVEFWTYG